MKYTIAVATLGIIILSTAAYSGSLVLSSINGVKNQTAAVSNSVVSKTTASSTVSESTGTTLCPIPQKIENYSLQRIETTNDSSQSTHNLYWNTDTGGLYNDMNPKENINLTYKNSDANSTSTVNVEIFRYTTEDDLRKDFDKILMTDKSNKGVKMSFIRAAKVKGYSRYGVLYFGTYVEAEINGSSRADAQKISSSLADLCARAPLYDTGVPKGFSSWKTSDLYKDYKKAYRSVADVDLTLFLSNVFFGAKPFVDDHTDILDGNFKDTVRAFKFFTVDTKGRLSADSIHLFVMKKTDKNQFVQFLKTNLITEYGILDNLTTDVSAKTVSYTSKSSLPTQKVDYVWSMSTSNKKITQHLYFVESENISIVLTSLSTSTKAVESIIDNIHITKLDEAYKPIVSETDSPFAKAKTEVLTSIKQGKIKDNGDCIMLHRQYLSTLSLSDVGKLSDFCSDSFAQKIASDQKARPKQAYNICGKSYTIEKVSPVKGIDLLARFSVLSNMKNTPQELCSDFSKLYDGKEIGIRKKEYDGANFLNFYPLYDKSVLNGENTLGGNLSFSWSTNIVNYFPSTLMNGAATYIGNIK